MTSPSSPAPRRSSIPTDVLAFLCLMLALLPFRALQTAHTRWMLVDGGYYTEVARHVRDGLGLSTHLSLYHMGYPYFPHPTPIYPLWPLVLGHGGRVFDLYALAHWLPMLLSFTAMAAAFLLGRTLWPTPLLPGRASWLHSGHVLAALLGTHREFIVYTSLPYTEGLAWTLTLVFLWRLAAARGAIGPGWSVACGLWLGLAFLARAQLVLLAFAVAAALAVRLLAGPDRARVAAHALGVFATFGLLLGGWWLHLRGILHAPSLAALLRFDQNRATDLLSPIVVLAESEGPLDFLRDRLRGVVVAYTPGGAESYGEAFYTAHWALPLALPGLLVAAVSAARAGRTALRALGAPSAQPWLVLGFLAFGGLLSVHLAHKQYNGEWYFDRRQGLVALFGFWLCLVWLATRPGALPRGVAAALFVSSLALGSERLHHHATDRRSETRGPDPHARIVEWLRARAAEKPGLVVAIDDDLAQRVAWRTTGVGYHWFHDRTSYADLRTMTDRLGAEYVVMTRRNHAARWDFIVQAGGRLEEDFSLLSDAPRGYVVLERKARP